MENNKMMKTAETMYTVVNILQKVLIAAIVLIVLGCVLMLAVGLNSIPVTTGSLSFGSMTVYLKEGALPVNTITPSAILITMISSLILVAVFLYAFGILKQILKPMKEGRPFETSVSEGIRKLGYAVLVGGVVRYITEFIAARILVNNYDVLRSVFREDVVDHIMVNASFSLSFIFMGFLLFLLSYIFRYGEELQRQSDETL